MDDVIALGDWILGAIAPEEDRGRSWLEIGMRRATARWRVRFAEMSGMRKDPRVVELLEILRI